MPNKAKGKQALVCKLSPSNSDKWLNCPGYGQAVAALPPREEVLNDAADEGTAAHSLFEYCGRMGVPPQDLLGSKFGRFTVDDEMASSVQAALLWVRDWEVKRAGSVQHEVPLELPLGDYVLTGTSDVIGYSHKTLALLAFDYKHGQGVWVDAENNSQVGLYILAAIHYLEKAGLKYGEVLGVIAQPRIDWSGRPVIREWMPTRQTLEALKARAVEATYEALIPGAPRRAGSHCKWCPAAATCAELAQYSLRTAMVEFEDIASRPVLSPSDPSELNADGLAYVMSHAPMIEAWLLSVRAESERRLLRHESVPGFKLVTGRTHKSWKSDGEVLKTVSGLKEYDSLAPRKPIGVTAMLAALKKLNAPEKTITRVEALSKKSNPPLHVAREEDPRPAMAGRASIDFQDFVKKS